MRLLQPEPWSANFALVAEWTGLLQGFEAFSCGPKRFWGYVPLAGSLSELLGPARLELLPFRSTWGAERVSAAARAWLAVPTPQPKFLFLNYIDAHGHRRRAPAPFDGQFVATSNDRRDQSIARYDGRIRFLDEQLGGLLAWLRAEGKLDRMLVVVTSDHGEFFGEHGHWDHGQAVYEEVLRVPLIVKLPHQREGRRVPGRVSLMQLPALVDAVLAGRAGPEVRLPEAPVVAEPFRPSTRPGPRGDQGRAGARQAPRAARAPRPAGRPAGTAPRAGGPVSGRTRRTSPSATWSWPVADAPWRWASCWRGSVVDGGRRPGRRAGKAHRGLYQLVRATRTRAATPVCRAARARAGPPWSWGPAVGDATAAAAENDGRPLDELSRRDAWPTLALLRTQAGR